MGATNKKGSFWYTQNAISARGTVGNIDFGDLFPLFDRLIISRTTSPDSALTSQLGVLYHGTRARGKTRANAAS